MSIGKWSDAGLIRGVYKINNKIYYILCDINISIYIHYILYCIHSFIPCTVVIESCCMQYRCRNVSNISGSCDPSLWKKHKKTNDFNLKKIPLAYNNYSLSRQNCIILFCGKLYTYTCRPSAFSAITSR